MPLDAMVIRYWRLQVFFALIFLTASYKRRSSHSLGIKIAQIQAVSTRPLCAIFSSPAYFSHFWFATVQEVLQADWQEAWHSPQPPVLRLSFKQFFAMVLICFILFLPILRVIPHPCILLYTQSRLAARLRRENKRL